MKMDNDFAKLQRETRKRNRKQAMGIFFGRGIIVKLCTVVVVGFIFMAVFADWITPYDPAAQNLVEKLQTPSASHWLGTDFLGRDVLSRVIYGGRVSMYVSLLSGSFAAVIGIGLGLVAGYVTGIVRRVIMGMTDIILSIPGMVFTLIIAAIMGTGVMSLTLAIGITYIRMVNGLVLSLKENDYIVASKLVGRSESKILLKHLLPNAFPSLIVLYTINLGNAIMTESSLSYLGVGINPPTATWGNMVSDAYAYLLQAPWLAMIPGICIIILIISFNVVGDGLRDALDPRLRGKL